MKKTFIKEIKEKDHVAGEFLVTRKEAGISKSGKPYLNLKLMDSTGELEARVWESAEELGRAFQKNDVVSVKGFAVAYQGGIQINVTAVSALKEGEYSIRDFLPCSKKDPAAMMAEVDGIISGLNDTHLRTLLSSIFNDAEIRERFMAAPAAKVMHHPYLGGLIEHVLSICGLAEAVVKHYGSGINRDLLITGAILHDIGKIYELSYKKSFDYTDEGRLLGHITMGIELIDRTLAGQKDFPHDLAVLLKHMLLSHHGQLEFGSPKRPKTIEAVILYYLDDLDSKVNTLQSLITEEGEGDSPWTPYQRLFERYIYRGKPSAAPEGRPSNAAANGSKDDKADKTDKTLSLFR
ncbi:MAG: HD domain-containing protein [Deltaproteobacteria bacterium]|nr:HD domain-containing protein [Deltaproteobacteria bacterium]